MTHYPSIIACLVVAACGGGGGSEGSSTSQGHCSRTNATLSTVPVVVSYGDSTQETAIDMLGSVLGVEYDNRAYGGHTLSDALNGTCFYHQTLAADLADDPTVVVVTENFGINETIDNATAVTFRGNLVRFVNVVRAAGKIPVIITPNRIYSTSNARNMRLAVLAQDARDVATSMDVLLIDVYALPTYNSDLNADGVHPTTAFLRRIAEFEASQLVTAGVLAQEVKP